MIRLVDFLKFLAIYNNENLHKKHKIFAKVGLIFSKCKINPKIFPNTINSQIVSDLVTLHSLTTVSLATVYSDRLSLHCAPISDAIDNIDNFFCIKQMIQL